MGVKWHCDGVGCKNIGQVNPLTEPVLEKVVDGKGVHQKDANGNLLYTQKKSKLKFQHPQTGKVDWMEVPMQKDVQPRSYIIRLSLGNEAVQRTLCGDCLTKLMKIAKPLWDELEKMEEA